MNLIHGLHFNNLRGDIFGGLTAAVVALPLAMAFGVSSGAGPIAGLYGAIFVGFFAALFGGTPAQISGPTGPMTVVMAAMFTQYVAIDPINGPAMAFTVVMMAGLLQILFGVLRIGNYINYMPQPVISGFMSGIGVIIILLQLAPLLGTQSAGGTISALKLLPSALANFQGAAFLLGLLTLAIVYFTPKNIGRIVPPMLLALLVCTLISALFLAGAGITILGDLPTGLPKLQMPVIELTRLPMMIKSALVLALLGTIDSLLTSLVADNLTRGQHRSNRELIGQGIGNTLAGLFGGLAGAGATMRTVVNVRAGGQTPISGMLHALVLLSIVLGLGSIAKNIPHVVLAGILIKVGTDIIDWRYLKSIKTAAKSGVIIMFTVLLLTVFVDLIMAVAIGAGIACLLFLKRQSDSQLASMLFLNGGQSSELLSEPEGEALARCEEKVLLFSVIGSLDFVAAKNVLKKFANQSGHRTLVLDLSQTLTLDYTGRCVLKEIVSATLEDGKKVLVANASGRVKQMLEREGVLADIEKVCFFQDRLTALKEAQYLSS